MGKKRSRDQADVGIITIRQDEFTSVLDRFPNRQTVHAQRRNYECARLEAQTGETYVVAVTRCLKQGQGAAQEVTRDFLEDINPGWILLVGIAGGIPDNEYTLGDVLLASHLHDFAVTAAVEGKGGAQNVKGGPVHKEVEVFLAHLPAWKGLLGAWNSPEVLGQDKPAVRPPELTEAKELYGDERWREKVLKSLRRHFPPDQPPRPPLFWIGSVASSNALVKDTVLARQWQSAARDLTHIEMELGGVYQAARQRDRECPILAIRGLSDIVGYERDAAWTEFACRSAASFAHAVIRSGKLPRRAGRQTGPAKPAGQRRRARKAVPAQEQEQQRPTPAPPTPEEAAPRAPASVDDLFHPDPCVSVPAAEEFIARGAALIAEVLQRMEAIPRLAFHAIRMVLRAFSREAAALMVGPLGEAGSRWGKALNVALCFDPAHAPYCAKQVAGILGNVVNPDVGRVCIEALGQMGASEWCFRIMEKSELGPGPVRVNEDLLQKWAPYALPAVARFFVRAGAQPSFMQRREVRSAFSELAHAVERATRRLGPAHQAIGEVEEVLAGCAPPHADVLLEEGLSSNVPLVRQLAVGTLGRMRLSRAVPHLLALAADPAEGPETVAEVIRALGNIRGPEAVQGLLKLRSEVPPARGRYTLWEKVLLSLALCLPTVTDEGQFRDLCFFLLQEDVYEKCWVYRAIGLRKEQSFVDRLTGALHSTEPSERGHAALALARLQADKGVALLRTAHAEASASQDRILTALALLTVLPAGEQGPLLVQLRQDLIPDSILFRRDTQEDILTVLRSCDHPEATLLARVWAEMYRARLAP